MATSADDGSAEGKILDQNSLCGACESNPPVKFCQNCTVTLCTTCMRAHIKLHSTSHHCLVDLDSDDEGNLTSKKSNSGYGKCRKHIGKNLDKYCSDCATLICIDCQPGHTGHFMQSFEDDWNIYERVCRKYMQSLLDRLHGLGEKKDFINGNLERYAEAIVLVFEWEKKLCDLIANYSQRLRNELTTIKDEWENRLNDETSGLLKRFNDIDDELSRLHDTRKIKNCEIMSNELAKCQEILAALDQYKTHFPDELNVLTVEEILPNEDQIKAIENGISCLLSTGNWTEDNTFGPVYNMIQLTGMKLLPNPNTECGYRMSVSNECRNFILHGLWNSSDVRVVERTTSLSKQYQSAPSWNIISVSSNEHVAISIGRDEINLLDSSFKVISTTSAPPGERFSSLCMISPLRFLALKSRKSSPFRAQLLWKRILGANIATEDEMTIDVEDEPHYMDIDKDRENVVICTHTMLYNVNIADKKGIVNKHDISAQMRTSTKNMAWSLLVDDDGNILVADELGNIHMYNQTFEHQVVVHVAAGVRDMVLKNGELIITTRNNKMLFYS